MFQLSEAHYKPYKDPLTNFNGALVVDYTSKPERDPSVKAQTLQEFLENPQLN